MRNIPLWLLLIICLVSGANLNAQSVIHAGAVPDEIKNDFKLRFNDATKVLWFKDSPNYYGARFKLEKKKIQAVYSTQDRQWVQTVEPITYEEMPDSAQRYISGKYPQHHHKHPQKVSTRSYGILYEVFIGKDLKTVELAFDMHGKLIREDDLVLENDSSIEPENEVSDEEKKPKGLKARLKKMGDR